MFSHLYKKAIVGVAVVFLSTAILIPASRLFGADSPSVAYLKQKTLSPWSIMALSAAGEEPSLESLKTVSTGKAIDIEAPILALTAAGKDPRSFGDTDLIEKLLGFYDGTQLGEAGILNDDIFGLLALIASGESIDSAAVAGTKSFILSSKNTDGGFSFAVGGTSDTNTTAAAIMALRGAGVPASDPALAAAVAYLRSAQNDDGGFPYDPRSPWGTGSDASSDAWVIMALQSLGESASSWSKSGVSVSAHLETLKQPEGFYLYQAGGEEDAFTPVTTSYALLALSGKTLPVKVTAASSAPTFSVQVEGKKALLCDTDGTGKTAIDALRHAASVCSFPYHIESSALGEYVDEIAGEKAGGSSGWLYTVNGAIPSVGAGAYKLKEGDAVRWYFGNYDGSSASEALRTEVPLLVTIPDTPQTGTPGSSTPEPTQEPSVSMIVEVGKTGTAEALGFGTAARGEAASKTISLKNSGAVATVLGASVAGDAVFRRYLRLDDSSWRDYRVSLAPSTSTTTRLVLTIPSDYAESGVKKGALVFWATPAAK